MVLSGQTVSRGSEHTVHGVERHDHVGKFTSLGSGGKSLVEVTAQMSSASYPGPSVVADDTVVTRIAIDDEVTRRAGEQVFGGLAASSEDGGSNFVVLSLQFLELRVALGKLLAQGLQLCHLLFMEEPEHADDGLYHSTKPARCHERTFARSMRRDIKTKRWPL